MKTLILAKLNECALIGIDVVACTEYSGGGSRYTSLTLRDISGKEVTIQLDMYGNAFQLYIQKPPVKEERFILTGNLSGFAIRQEFKTKEEAENAASTNGLKDAVIDTVQIQVS